MKVGNYLVGLGRVFSLKGEVLSTSNTWGVIVFIYLFDFQYNSSYLESITNISTK